MPKNLEVKARINSISGAFRIANSLNLKLVDNLNQCDTYFNVPRGRLKLRVINNTNAELIFYTRDESLNLRQSSFEIYPVIEPAKIKLLLQNALGINAVIKKRRSLFLYYNSRIHIDDVDGLGLFIEFEVPIRNDEKVAFEMMNYLVKQFSVRESDFIKVSYLDLIKY